MKKLLFLLCFFVPTLVFAQKIDSVLFSNIQCSGWKDNAQLLSFDLKENTLYVKGIIAAAGCGNSYIKYEIYDDSIYLQRVEAGTCTSICLYDIDFTIDNCTSDSYKIRYDKYGLDVDTIVYPRGNVPGSDFINVFESDSVVWKSRLELGIPGIENPQITETILYGDTVIDYTKWRILTRWDFKGLVRTEGAKVLFKAYPGYEGHNIIEEETVIYDFSLKVGEHSVGMWSSEVIKVDSILLNDGQKHKKIYFENDFTNYVEGLGCDVYDPFFMIHTAAPTMAWIQTLICCHVDGELLYMNPDYLDCSGDKVDNEIIADSYPKVNVLFANEQLRITFADDVSFDAAVYNMQGMLVAQRKGNYGEASISLNSMARGVYFVRVSSGEYVYTQKFIKR